jgi:hypothetical protein
MYDNWIYNHFINTSLFIAFCLSLPLAFGIWLLFSLMKISNKENSK